MRKLTFLLLLLVAGGTLHAQPSKKDFITGATFGFNYRDTPQSDTQVFTEGFSRRLNVTLNGEYFLTNRLSVGLSLGIIHSYYFSSANSQGMLSPNYSSKIETGYGENLYTIAGILKYYIPITGKLYFSLEFSPGYGISKNRDYYYSSIDYGDGEGYMEYKKTETIQHGSMFFASFTPALEFFLSRRFVITASAGGVMYQHEKMVNIGGAPIRNVFEMNWGEFALGLSFRF